MANSQLHCAYKAIAVGKSPSALAALLAAVPIDLSLPRAIGVIPSADATSSDATEATRAIVLDFGSAYSTTVGIDISDGSPRGPIRSATVQAGVPTNYPCPPVLSFTDPTGSGATGYVEMGVGGAHILAGGTGYTPATTTATLVGGDLRPGGTPAVVTPTFTLGVLTGVTVVSAGKGYTTFPQVALHDPSGGSGAVVVLSLTPVAYVIQQPGTGYSAPTLNLTPRFVNGCPDTSDQAANVKEWMTTILQQGALTVIQETDPVVT